ncbi:MAG: hypothetical protein Q7N87_01665 [Candidatus Uhrbacteria bacterium]|nr:hypothetical protein [Candidatus Uhrbacteria bacterium]
MKIHRSLARLMLFVPWVICGGILVWLIALRFPFDGKRHLTFTFDGTSPWFDAFLPAERVTPVGLQEDGWMGQRIKDEPVYAGARMPGVFDRVTVGLDFKPTRQPLLEFGMLRDPQQPSSFELRPLWSEVLSKRWRRVEQGSLRGYVKNNQQDSVLGSSDFEHLLVWRAAASSPKLMDRARETRAILLDLSGSHDFFLVPTDGELRFHFQMEDRSSPARFVDLRMERDGQVLWTRSIPGNQEYKIEAQAVAAGVYKMSVRAPDNQVRITRITTNMRHWVIGPRLNLAAGVRVWTNSHHVTPLSSSPVRPGDTRVIGDGYFSFDQEALFLPQPRRLTDATDADREKIIGVLTTYQPPEVLSDGWLRAHSDFSLDRVRDRIKFVLSAPGLASRQGLVDVRAVDLWYARPPLSWQEFLRVMRRELSGIKKRLWI